METEDVAYIGPPLEPPTEDELKELLDVVGLTEPPKAEDGWFTVKELAERRPDLANDTIYRYLLKAFEKDKIERVKYLGIFYYRKLG